MSEFSPIAKPWPMLEYLQRDPAYMPHEIGAQLASLIYLRWADFQEAECEAIAAFDETEYTPVLPASMHWRSWQAKPPDQFRDFLSDILPAKLQALGNERHNPLATQLHRMADPIERLGKFSLQSLLLLVDWLADQPFETPTDRRALLDVFDLILERIADKWVNEYRTPKAVMRLMVEIADPAQGDRIYDPCFGSAGLLTAACDHVQQSRSSFGRQAGAPISVSGVELNREAFVIGLTRLALAGVEAPNIENGNSLERPATVNPRQEGFDLIVANPPFGGRISREGLEHFQIKTNDTAGLFIQHALSQLRPNGRAVIAVPHGILFRGGQEQRLREMLIKQHDVEAIVSLPAGTFAPHTSIPSSILVLCRKGPTERVRMVDAEEFITPGKGRKPASIRMEQAKELARRVHASTPEKDCWDVDVATIAESDWDFTPKRRDQSGLWSMLDALRSEVEVASLKECCLILGGRFVKSADLTEEPSGEGAIPYIRIRDLQKGQVEKGSSWIREDSEVGVDAQRKLRAGDVLLSKSGTIGKAAIVRNGAVGARANSGLYILQPDMGKVDPRYLVAYLSCSECTSWFSDRSRGAAIQHLTKKVVEDLPVPLPPLPVQQRVAEHHREHGVDVFAYLSQLLLDGDNDPVVDWLDKVAHRIEELPSVKSKDLSAILDLGLWGSGFKHLRNSIAHDESANPLGGWVLSIDGAVESLRDAGAVPPGPALYLILQQSVHGLDQAQSEIKGHLPNANRARELTKKIIKRIKKALACLLDDLRITVLCDQSEVAAGEIITTEIGLRNQGKLPLRKFSVSTEPDWGGGRLGYLAEGAEEVVRISGVSPRDAGPFSLQVSWQAIAIDGCQVEGKTELAFSVVESQMDITLARDLGASPYVCGDPIAPDRGDIFVGRDELLESIHRQVMQTGNVVLLEGNRRSGKTSILKHLCGSEGIPGWLGIYCSLQGAEGSSDGVGVPTVEVFRAMATAIAKGVQSIGGETPLPNGDVLPVGKKLGIARACREGIVAESAFSDFRDYVEVILDVLKQKDVGLLLMLDEFDKLQEGIDNGVTSPQVPENIRYMVQNYPRFSAILTGSRRLQRLREEYWSALYGLGTRIGVTSLSDFAAARLITEPVKGRLTYAGEAVKEAVRMTARQPFLIQCICNRVFDIAVRLKTRSITIGFVEQAASALVADNEHFASLWDYARTNRRRYILALCHQSRSDPESLRFGVIQERLLDAGIEVNDEDLSADLNHLRELELIELDTDSPGDHYKLAVPLMGIWIERQRDIEVVLAKAKAEMEDSNE